MVSQSRTSARRVAMFALANLSRTLPLQSNSRKTSRSLRKRMANTANIIMTTHVKTTRATPGQARGKVLNTPTPVPSSPMELPPRTNNVKVTGAAERSKAFRS